MQLRDYQHRAVAEIHGAWVAVPNVLAVLPTGAGKTVVFSHILHSEDSPCIAIAHRQELVIQMSTALARHGVRHRIVAPSNVVKLATRAHYDAVGESFYSPSSVVAVAGVDTLIRRADDPALQSWFKSVTLWVQDEAHHVLASNKWGLASAMFPNARGLGVTATPTRADGRGLGRHADGLFDAMVVGPTMRDLIRREFLTEYRIFAPPSDLDLTNVKTSKATGDYNTPDVRAAVKKSHVIGDVVAHYLKIAPGKLGVTFAVDVDTATIIAEQFNAAGVPALVVSAKSTSDERSSALRKFKNREVLQLVNVDLFGEGFDLPAIEVVSMARPTQSFALFAQQFGRALRLMDGKTEAVIIDHVGNVMRHGLPDSRNDWTLDAREKRGRASVTDAIPVTTCLECFNVYERLHSHCPYCGHKPVPMARSGPEFVDGDLFELDAETLAAMRGEVDVLDGPFVANPHQPAIGQAAANNRHKRTQETQRDLRDAIATWAGVRRAAKDTDSQIYKRFYFRFGVDILSAKALKERDALALLDKVKGDL